MKIKWSWCVVVFGVAALARFCMDGGSPVFSPVSNVNSILEHELTMVKMVLPIEELQSYRQQFLASVHRLRATCIFRCFNQAPRLYVNDAILPPHLGAQEESKTNHNR